MSVNTYTLPPYPSTSPASSDNVTPIVLIGASVVGIAAVLISDKFIKRKA